MINSKLYFYLFKEFLRLFKNLDLLNKNNPLNYIYILY